MNCSRIRELLGPYTDGELSPEESEGVRNHLGGCTRCTAELEQLDELSRQLARYAVVDAHVRAPAEIWSSIEQRLDGRRSDTIRVQPNRGRVARLFYRPAALAASLALLLGVGVLFTAVLDRSAPSAYAATIDYSILMDGVASDVRGCIDRFLTHYRAEPIERTAAHSAAAHLSFDLPEKLPSGHHFVQAYRFKLGDSHAIAATYEADGTPLFLIFHSVRDNVKGPQGMACRIGDLRAGQIEAGPWTLIHVMDDTTCHCVLSTLQDSELEPVVRAVAPALETGTAHQHAH